MTWIVVAHLLVLAFFTVNTGRIASPHSLRYAWRWLAAVATSHIVFNVIRQENIHDSSDMARIELWADGFQWLFLGFSIYCLSSVVPLTTGGEKK
jgi:hypothetical protein